MGFQWRRLPISFGRIDSNFCGAHQRYLIICPNSVAQLTLIIIDPCSMFYEVILLSFLSVDPNIMLALRLNNVTRHNEKGAFIICNSNDADKPVQLCSLICLSCTFITSMNPEESRRARVLSEHHSANSVTHRIVRAVFRLGRVLRTPEDHG